jgi:PAS domain S-box-containing protein
LPGTNGKGGHFGTSWLTVCVLLASLGTTLLVWRLVRANERTHLRKAAGLAAQAVQADVSENLGASVEAQVELAKLWEFGDPSYTQWSAAVNLFIQHHRGCVGVEWLDPGNDERWQVGVPEEQARQLPPATQELRERLLKAALQSRRPLLSPAFLAPDSKRLHWVVVPVYRQERLRGLVLASFEIKRLLDYMLNDVKGLGFSIVVSEAGQEIYRFVDGSREPERDLGATADIVLPGVRWQLEVWPRPDALNVMRTRLPEMSLLAGLLVASLLTLTVNFGQRNAAKSASLQRSHEKLESEILEHRRTEEALWAARARFTGIVEISADALISTDENQRITLFNQGAEKVFGYSAREVQGQPLDILIPERLREIHRRHVAAFLQSKQQTLRMSQSNYLLGLRKDGSEFRMESSVAKLEIGGDKIFTAILRDMTDWVRTQEELRSARDQLETRVRVRTAQLEQANQALQTEIAERQRVEEALRGLSGRLLQIQDEERRRFARELHDGATQNLMALAMNLAAMRDTGSATNRVDALRECISLVDQSLDELRTISFVLHPPLLETMGLRAALPAYVKGFGARSGIQVSLEMSAELGRLGPDVELTLYRILQEALANVHRHSHSPTVKITVSQEAERVTLEVADEGCGMPQSADGHRLGVGITGMRERVRLLGGSLEIQSSDRGTTMRAVLPTGVSAPSSAGEEQDLSKFV